MIGWFRARREAREAADRQYFAARLAEAETRLELLTQASLEYWQQQARSRCRARRLARRQMHRAAVRA